MLKISLEYKDTVPLECERLRPDTLATLTPFDIQNIPCWRGNKIVALGDLARIEGDSSDGHLLLEGDWSRVKRIGQAMESGRLEIDGPAGMHAGSGMKGGHLLIRGDAGDWTAAEMKGGFLEIEGNAGHGLGAGYAGARSGMRGGQILIRGNAGNELGSLMRRGLIVVTGSAGDFAGLGMIAGSLVLLGGCGIRPGAAMKRGSIVCGQAPASILPSFSEPVQDRPLWLELLRKDLALLGLQAPFAHLPVTRHWNISRGDRVALGLGELLWPVRPL